MVKVKTLIKQLKSEVAAPEFIYFDDFKSRRFTSTVHRTLQELQVEYSVVNYKNPSQLIDLLNECDAVVSTKLHVTIVATTLGKPTLACSVHEKTKRYFEQIGYPHLQANLDSSESVNFDKFLQMISRREKIVIPSSVLEKSEQTMKILGVFDG